MKFIVDENAGTFVAQWLASAGFEVFSIYDEMPGISDEEILQMAHKESFVIITSDKDFGELVFKNKLPHKGVILLRLVNESSSNKIKFLKTLLERHSGQLPGRFTVLTERGVRIY